MLLTAALLFGAAVQAPAAADLVGFYETSQIEVAAGLELQKSGHFRYALDYGAVSERTEGDWTFDGTTLRLTSNPMPPKLHALELGNARFERQPIALKDGDLFLERYETIFRFRRVEP